MALLHSPISYSILYSLAYTNYTFLANQEDGKIWDVLLKQLDE